MRRTRLADSWQSSPARRSIAEPRPPSGSLAWETHCHQRLRPHRAPPDSPPPAVGGGLEWAHPPRLPPPKIAAPRVPPLDPARGGRAPSAPPSCAPGPPVVLGDRTRSTGAAHGAETDHERGRGRSRVPQPSLPGRGGPNSSRASGYSAGHSPASGDVGVVLSCPLVSLALDLARKISKH